MPRGKFIMSNAMDIVNAMSVAGPAEVTHWDEQEDEQEDLGQWFLQTIPRYQKAWRSQRLRIVGAQAALHLSQLLQPEQDDVHTKCPHGDCGIWNHEYLVDAISDRKYERLVEESGPALHGTERTVWSTMKDVVT
jgi:hypothetical protein